ncbi:MAG: M20/M25/M40 family metallo-hydrolase, partial [Alphaproteobacteria bacterium]|nr:M20/M25/M40 family metallo-hydrolase [Alphaproteobacteria bacterium]
GKLYGRGGADDGYALFASVCAVKALLEQGVALPRIVVMIEFSEESGSPDLPAYVDAYAKEIGHIDLVICLDSGAGNYEQMWTTTNLRGMVENATGQRGTDGLPPRTLVELKGVELTGDAAYPLYGAVRLESGAPLDRQLGRSNGQWGAVVDPVVLDKLQVEVGDQIRLGEGTFLVRDVILKEPDRTADGFTLAPRVMISHEALGQTGLVKLGSLIRYHYKLALSPGQGLQAEKAWLEETFPEAGWRVRDNQSGAAGTERFLGRLSVFLTLAGLTALVVGGVGIANAISGYVNAKRDSIATFKSLGASGRQIFWAYLTQTVVLGFLGVGIGLFLAALIPFVALQLLADILPVPAQAGVYTESLVLAGGYGVLTVLAFSIWPLGRSRDVPAAGLFRQIVAPISGRPRWQYILGAVIALALLIGLALAFAGNWVFTSWFLAGAAASFAVLYGAGWAIMRLSAHIPRPRLAFLRTALANLHRPGAPTPSVVLSLGLGLTLLVVIAQIEANLSAQINENLPEDAPAFFFVDVQTDDVDAFEDTLAGLDGVNRIERAPMLRATITRIDGTPVREAKVAPDAQWAIRGDRGLTYSRTPPEGTTITAGEWWDPDYSGPPQISFDADIAAGMDI